MVSNLRVRCAACSGPAAAIRSTIRFRVRRDRREHLSHLEGVTAVARDAQLSAARNVARKQLADSVAAIETIRLDLLRLLGGDADLRPMTTAIDAARKIDSDISRLRTAQSEADR